MMKEITYKGICIISMVLSCCLTSISSIYASTEIEQGYSELKNNDLNAATQSFQIAIKNDPNSLDAKLGLAQTYNRRGYKNSVQSLVGEILDVSPNNVGALLLQGQLYVRSKDWAAAKDIFENIISVDGNNLDAHLYLANALNKLGDAKAAMVVYEKLKLIQETLK